MFDHAILGIDTRVNEVPGRIPLKVFFRRDGYLGNICYVFDIFGPNAGKLENVSVILDLFISQLHDIPKFPGLKFVQSRIG